MKIKKKIASIEFTRIRLVVALAALLLWVGTMVLYSENLTLTTSYPSPAGIYRALTSTGDTILARDGGRVGIGTAGPAYKFDVSGAGRFSANGRVYLADGAPAGARGLELFESNAASFEVRAHDPGVRWMNLLLNSQGGNVGIGISNPARTLDVNGSILVRNMLIEERGLPAFLVNIAWNDCPGRGVRPPFMGCPGGYAAVGWWHVGDNACDNLSRGWGYSGGWISRGWMVMCAAS